VESLEGSRHTKKRLRAILETISGQKSVAKACEDLGIGEAMFHRIRKEALEGALAALQPKPIGRPRNDAGEGQRGDVRELEEENLELKIALRAAQVREELAATLPQVLQGREKKRRGRGRS
jgi:transposase-like protein